MASKSLPGKRKRISPAAGETDSDTAVNTVTHFDSEMVLNAYAVVINLQSVIKESEKYIYTRDKSVIPLVLESRSGYLAALDKLGSLERKEENKELIQNVRTALTKAREANAKVFEAVEKGDIQTAVRIFTTTVAPTVQKVQGMIPELLNRAKIQGLVTELVDRAAAISRFDFEKILYANTVLINLQALLTETAKIVYTKDPSSIPLVLRHRAKYLDALDNLEKLATDPEEKEIITKLAAALAVGRAANNKLFDAVATGKIDEAMSLFSTIVDPTLHKVKESVTELGKRSLPLKMRSAESTGILDGSENIYRVLDSLHEGVMILDADSTITYLNPAYTSILGVPTQSILWKKLSDIEPQSKALRALETKQPITGGYDVLKNIGKHFLFDANLITRTGSVVGLVIIIREISDVIELNKIIKQYEKSDDSSELTKDKLPVAFKRIIGSNPKFVKTLWFASQVSPTEAPVLLEGESGVGKELFAWAIHNTSPRSKKPMISINCAAIPESLYESELFGYEEGAFTGARKSGKPGKFELASGGTLFLDEIAEMPLNMQSKLLRVLQEGNVDPLGGTKQIPIDTRIIAATNKNLAELVDEKKFRQDLFYRLNVINIKIPSLRERTEDIPELAEEFIRQYNSDVKPSPEVLNAFFKYPWQGNVRELKNVIYRAVILCQGREIVLQDLPACFMDSISKASDSTDEPAAESPSHLKGFVAESEKEKILLTLTQCSGNRSKAMETLGISRRTFYKKLKKYNIA
jgi:transcriptional regulator with PAS, ATPase and Fis domain